MRYFQHLPPALLIHRRAIGISLTVLTLLAGGYAVTRSSADMPAIGHTATQAQQASGTGLTTVSPVMVSGSSSVVLLGSVLSHETANIYPRRDGIVEDIYVDIGDTVTKNQVVALLLPKGVEGQSAAMIAEKQARKAQAESDLSTTEEVAEETLISTRQRIREKETELLVAQREQTALLDKFAESEAQVRQMREQAFVAAQRARQLVQWIILGSNSQADTHISDTDILRNLGLQDAGNAARYTIVDQFNTLYTTEETYLQASSSRQSHLIDQVLTMALGALRTTNALLQYTPTQPSANGIDQLSHEQLTDRLNKLTATQDSLFKVKERLEDARISFDTLTASEPELYQAYRSGNTADASSNKVRLLEQQIRTAQNTLELTTANQEQMIEMKERQVDIADAMLRSEYATSGNRQILSPFSGTVSKRFIDVGQIVMPSMSAFELTDVPTSLAKQAKAEIQFGLPERLIDAVSIGDTVTFFLQTDEQIPYTAEVRRKSPQVDLQTHTVTVQAKIPDNLTLPHGASVRVRLTDTTRPIFRVPSSAVKREAERNYVWVSAPDATEPVKRTVSVIAEDGEFAEVTGDLTTDSAVILDPPPLFL